MSNPTLATIKRLFGLSGNKCAFPGCSTPLIEESGTVTGEICHIRAANAGGPRYDKAQNDKERAAADNLILLCARHHTIIDSETAKYSQATLQGFKTNATRPGSVEISQSEAAGAKKLLESYLSVVINANSGQIAIQSPGAIQTHNLTIKTTKPKVTVSPPSGTIASDRALLSYSKYLIERYQEFQKADQQKVGEFKFIAIHMALKREFKGDWKLWPSDRSAEVFSFLQRRIDNTKQGRINRSKLNDSYHTFEEHT